MQEYSEYFGLLDHIVFNASVEKVHRDGADSKWLVEIAKPESSEVLEFDKVVFCHGYQTQKKMPSYPGQDQYTGVLIHSQEYRKYVHL
jgi:dimethylaniline monooxygenase (N-oxide forming)